MKSSLRALLVEDDRSWQQILREILNDAGLEVDVAVDLPEALTLISQNSHRLAVVDLSLVTSDHLNRDGFKVLRAVRQHDPGCTTVLLTGFATVEIAVSALTDLGVYTCLRKEMFHRGEFQNLIYKALSAPPFIETQATYLTPLGANGSDLAETKESSEYQRAIVVEDDAGWQEIFLELLADAGFQVRVCHSFGEAFGCLRRESYRLAVVDLSLNSTVMKYSPADTSSLPDWDGYRLLANFRTAGIPAVVVSGVANADDIERVYKEQGIFSFIEKQTFNRRVFMTTIKEAVKARQKLSQFRALTVRELEVLEMLSQGLTNKEIAEALFITTNTVKRHLKSIFEKLDIHTRSAAAAMAANWFGGSLGEEKKAI